MRRAAAALAAAVAAAAWLFHEALSGRVVLFERDVHLYWHPHLLALRRALSGGAWPVWNPYVSFGQPLLANPATQVCYPPTILALFLDPSTCYVLYVVGHLVFAALGAWAAARQLGLRSPAATAAALFWMLSGPLVSMANLWHHLAGASWLPWVFLAAERALERPGGRRAVLWGGVVAAQVLAGSADMLLLGALMAFLQLVSCLDWRRPLAVGNHRVLATAAGAVAVAVGLSAVLWLPVVDQARGSARRDLPGGLSGYWSLPPALLAQAAVPAFLDPLPLQTGTRAALYEGRDAFFASVYLGLPVLGLAAAGLLAGRGRTRVVLASAVLLALALALGRHTPVHGLLSDILPPLRSLRYPVKATALAALAAALLAGLGLEGWSRLERRRRLIVVAALALTAATLLAGAWQGHAPGPWVAALLERSPEGPPYSAILAPVARQLAATGLVGLATALGLGLGRRRWALAAAALAVLDLLHAHRALHATADRRLLSETPPLVAALRPLAPQRLYVYEYWSWEARRRLGRDHAVVVTEGWLARFPSVWTALAAAERVYLLPPLASGHGLRGSFDRDMLGLYPAPLDLLVRSLKASEGTALHLRLLRMAGVSHVVSLHTEGLGPLEPVLEIAGVTPEPIRLLRVPDPAPRCSVVGTTVQADGRDAITRLAEEGHDPAFAAVLADAAPRAAPPGFHGDCRVTSERADHLRLEAQLSHPGVLVLADAHDPGWRVKVDGAPAPLRRANLAFRGVELAAGRHVVEMDYRPTTIPVGLGASLVTALGCLLAAWPGTPGARRASGR